MGSVYKRKNKLWIRFKGDNGKWTQSKTPFHVGQEREARKLLDRVQAKIAAGEELGIADEGPLTVERFAKNWIADRKAVGVTDWANDERRLKLHVLPHIGAMAIDEVRPRHLANLMRDVRTRLAPRTVRNVYSVVRALFRDAVLADLTEQTPAILGKYQLGTVEDADPEWRATAIYTRGEVEQLISDDRLTVDQNVWYALQALAGLRPGEAAPLRWKHYDTDLEPLGRLIIANSNLRRRTKSGVVRYVPVHPTLAAMLAEWKLRGWVALMGRRPAPDDLIMPTPAARRVKLGEQRRKDTWGPATREDLKTLGLRHRRGYDLRRSFISLARTDGARPDILKLVTHGSDGQRNMMDLYSTLDWSVLCAEVAKLRIDRVERGKVIALPLAKASGDNRAHASVEDQVLATPFATPDGDPPKIAVGDGFRRRDSKTGDRHTSTRYRTVTSTRRRRVGPMRPESGPIQSRLGQRLGQWMTSSGRSRERSPRPLPRADSTSSPNSPASSRRGGSRVPGTSSRCTVAARGRATDELRHRRKPGCAPRRSRRRAGDTSSAAPLCRQVSPLARSAPRGGCSRLGGGT